MSEKNYENLRLCNQLCFPLYAASREIIKAYRPHLDELNLTYTQYIAMLVFWEYSQISVKDLGKMLYLDSGTLTPVLKSLESKGYITRHRSNQDERVLIAEITKSGKDLKNQAMSIPLKMSGCVKLSPEEARFLHQILYKILEG